MIGQSALPPVILNPVIFILVSSPEINIDGPIVNPSIIVDFTIEVSPAVRYILAR